MSANILSSYAFADARHDFSVSMAAAYYTVLQASLPGRINAILDEDGVINSAQTLTGRTFKALNTESANDAFIQLGGSETIPIAIVCDAGFCGRLIDLLSHTTIGKVYLIQNRERYNDSGVNKSIDSYPETISILHDIDKSDIVYERWNGDDDIITKLCSIYNVSLSQTKLTTRYNNTVVDNISFKEKTTSQSAPTLKKYINQLSQNASSMYDLKYISSIQTAFLRKRCGDWLQILSCIDRDRLYEDGGGHLRNLKNVKTYFCSTDKIPLGYAVYLGINCIRQRSNTNFEYFQNDTDDISLNYERGQSLAALKEYATMSTTEYAKNVATIKHGFDFYNTQSEIFQPYLETVTEAKDVTELKKYLGNALKFAHFVELYRYLHEYSYLINAFLASPEHPEFSERDQRLLRNAINGIRSANITFADINIDAPYYDDVFVYSDPTSYEVKYSKSSMYYSVVYCQAILYSIMGIARERKSDSLIRFVYNFSKAITSLTDDPTIMTHYSLFMDTFPEFNSGGGVPHSYRKKDLIFIGEHLAEFLMYKYQETDITFVRIAKITQVSVGDGLVCMDILRRIILKYNTQIPSYIQYLTLVEELSGLDDDDREVLEFLHLLTFKTPI